MQHPVAIDTWSQSREKNHFNANVVQQDHARLMVSDADLVYRRARAGTREGKRRRARAGTDAVGLGLLQGGLQDLGLSNEGLVGLGQLVVLIIRLFELLLEVFLEFLNLFELLELLEQLDNVALAICC